MTGAKTPSSASGRWTMIGKGKDTKISFEITRGQDYLLCASPFMRLNHVSRYYRGIEMNRFSSQESRTV